MPRLAGFSLLLFGAFTLTMGLNSGRGPWILAGLIVGGAALLMITGLVRSRTIILGALSLAAIIGYIAQIDAAETTNLGPTVIAWAVWIIGWFALGTVGTSQRAPSPRPAESAPAHNGG